MAGTKPYVSSLVCGQKINQKYYQHRRWDSKLQSTVPGKQCLQDGQYMLPYLLPLSPPLITLLFASNGRWTNSFVPATAADEQSSSNIAWNEPDKTYSSGTVTFQRRSSRHTTQAILALMSSRTIVRQHVFQHFPSVFFVPIWSYIPQLRNSGNPWIPLLSNDFQPTVARERVPTVVPIVVKFVPTMRVDSCRQNDRSPDRHGQPIKMFFAYARQWRTSKSLHCRNQNPQGSAQASSASLHIIITSFPNMSLHLHLRDSKSSLSTWFLPPLFSHMPSSYKPSSWQ
jgi:hypothetical protein